MYGGGWTCGWEQKEMAESKLQLIIHNLFHILLQARLPSVQALVQHPSLASSKSIPLDRMFQNLDDRYLFNISLSILEQHIGLSIVSLACLFTLPSFGLSSLFFTPPNNPSLIVTSSCFAN
jgi:hypothetical protein